MNALHRYHTNHGYEHIVIVSEGTKWIKYVSPNTRPLTVRTVPLVEKEYMTEAKVVNDPVVGMLEIGKIIGITKTAHRALTKLLEDSESE